MVKQNADNENKLYVVLKHKENAGLTVRSGVLKPGQVFSRKDYRGDDADFEAALKDKRFEEFKSGSIVETEEVKTKKYIASLEAEIEKLGKSKTNKEFKELENAIEDLQKQLEEQTEQIETLKSEKEELQKQLEEQTEQNPEDQGNESK